MANALIAFGGTVSVVKKSAKKAVKKPAAKTRAAKPKASARAKAAKIGKPKPTASARRATRSPTAPTFGKPEIKKIQGLLKSKTADGVTLALSLLESLNASQTDYEEVFTEKIIHSVLGGWVPESWSAVATALLPRGQASKLFQKIAEEKFLNRPSWHQNFNGLLLARIPVAKAALLARKSGQSESRRSLVDFVNIPAGTFKMGSPEDEEWRLDNENQVSVRITKPFRMGKTVVTQGHWRTIMGTEPWRYETLSKNLTYKCKLESADDFPAVCVGWEDAVLFCQTLTELERHAGRLTATQVYRLPTEAEWEYACRAGTETAYSFGDDDEKADAYCWYDSNAGGRMHKVAEKKPNLWGLFDMHGNVLEWCADWYSDTLAGGDDPVGPNAGSRRVNRGGYWDNSLLRCAQRVDLTYLRNFCHGFRLVLSE